MKEMILILKRKQIKIVNQNDGVESFHIFIYIKAEYWIKWMNEQITCFDEYSSKILFYVMKRSYPMNRMYERVANL